MDAKRLISLIAATDNEARSYSGRAMYGTRCVATVLPAREVLALGAALAYAAADAVQVTDEHTQPTDFGDDVVAAIRDVAEFMRGSRVDSMGKDDEVVYWPDVEWPADLCESCGSEKPAGQSCGCFDNGGQ